MYRASIENQGDARYSATTPHGSFGMAVGGKGPGPVDVLLAALCGCVGHYVNDFLRARAIPATRITVAAEAETTSDRSRLGPISVRIDLGEARLDPALDPELLAFIERCPIHGTLRQACRIDAGVERKAAALAG